MGILQDFKALNLLRVRRKHVKYGHGSGNVLVDKLTSEKHPHTDAELVYTVNIMACKLCGLTYLDAGLEHRNKWWK